MMQYNLMWLLYLIIASNIDRMHRCVPNEPMDKVYRCSQSCTTIVSSVLSASLVLKNMLREDLLSSSSPFVPISPQFANVRRFWTTTSHSKKNWYSGSDLIGELLLDDAKALRYEYRCNAGFHNFFRMSSMEFERLLNLIGPKIAKMEVDCRKDILIPINERLGLTLRFLASGDSLNSLMYTFKIPKQVISKVIPEVCDALVETLKDFIKTPKNESEWRKVATLFHKRWNFPNCIGAIDGKQITLQGQFKYGTDFYNCKGFFRIVLFAVIDSDYNFIYANVGCQGRISDGGTFRGTKFKKVLEENTMHVPLGRPLPGQTVTTPFVFLGDDAFPLTTNVMKPFPGSYDKKSKKRIFNYRLNRGRRVSDNVFGIISAVFRVLRTPMLLQPETAKKVTMAIIYLHNFLRKSPSKLIYNPPGTFDQECPNTGELTLGIWRQDESGGFTTLPTIPRRSTSYAESVRKQFTEYFISPEGKLIFKPTSN